ncbi:MAG TPA: RodZ domain-containing protein [Blastocatellia bacterium]|nr:RodZ domain-containing protein [Blastocatellia bacterium]
MPTLGEELRTKREAKGITLAQISDATRIGTRFLKAIESDNFAVLPGGIFTRSFIRAYARQVGMGEDEAIDLYHQAVAGQSDENLEVPPEEPPEKTSQPVPWRKVAVIVAVPLIAVGVVIALIKVINSPAKATAPVQQPAVVESDRQPGDSQPTRRRPADTPGSLVSTSSNDGSSGELELSVEATAGDCWLRYQVDDAGATSIILKAGESKDLPRAHSKITLIIGNKKNLKIRINNRHASFPPDVPNFKAQVQINQQNLRSFLTEN